METVPYILCGHMEVWLIGLTWLQQSVNSPISFHCNKCLRYFCHLLCKYFRLPSFSQTELGGKCAFIVLPTRQTPVLSMYVSCSYKNFMSQKSLKWTHEELSLKFYSNCQWALAVQQDCLFSPRKRIRMAQSCTKGARGEDIARLQS